MWRHGDLAFTLDYEFDPASPTDGLTIDVPLADLQRTDPAVFEWNVPGRRAELIEAMIRSRCPSDAAAQFIPIADTVAAVQTALRPGEERLVAGPSPRLGPARETSPIPPDAFDATALPAHLRSRFRVIGGRRRGGGRGRGPLRPQGASRRSGPHDHRQRCTIPWSTHGLTSWSIGDLPESVQVGDGAHRATVFPALVDDGDSVSVLLVPTRRRGRGRRCGPVPAGCCC